MRGDRLWNQQVQYTEYDAKRMAKRMERKEDAMDTVRSAETKEAFIKYLADHPEERFWQAVRNFSGYSFTLASDILPVDDQLDTCYWEGRTHLEAMQH